MSSIIYDFEALGEACDKLSPHIRDKSMCSYCENVGWVLGADPRHGFPERGFICPQCKNRYCHSNPWPPGDAQEQPEPYVPPRFRKYPGKTEPLKPVQARRAKAQEPPRAMGSSQQIDDDDEIKF